MTVHFLAPEDKSKWHPTWNKCFDSWTKTKYDLNIWTDEGIDNLLEKHDNEFYKNYLSKINPIFKFDYVRFIILEHYRGMYLDMDIELVNDFIPNLHPDKIYMMEGDIGELYSNCLMVSPDNLPVQEVWRTLRLFCKQRIIDNFELCKDKYNVMLMVGPFAISEWFAKYFNEFNLPKVGVLSKYHFSQVDSDISFTKHHTTSVWNRK